MKQGAAIVFALLVILIVYVLIPTAMIVAIWLELPESVSDVWRTVLTVAIVGLELLSFKFFNPFK